MTNKKKLAIWSIGAICVVLVTLYVYPLVRPLFTSTVVHEAPLVSTVSIGKNMEVIKGQSLPTPVWKGMFTGFDRLHNGTGTAHITETQAGYILRFEDDFKVTNGPDLYVGFGKDGKYVEGSEIALLKGNIGAQNYQSDIAFDSEKYNEVWIWCKRFSEPFAKAVLTKI